MVVRRPKAQLGEENRAHRVVIVLAGVDEVDACAAALECVYDRLHLHEVGSSSGHAERVHDGRPYSGGTLECSLRFMALARRSGRKRGSCCLLWWPSDW